MTGLNKFDDKQKRQQRRNFQRNHIAQDLHTPKYKQRVIENKRSDHKADRYYEDEVDW